MDNQNKKNKDNNNMRMIEINTYYGEQYKAYIEVLKIVVFFSLIVLILTILKNMSLVPDLILNGLLGLVIIFGLLYTLWLSYDISLRDNMNFNQYNWEFSKPSTSNIINDNKYEDKDNTSKSFSESLGMGCIGMECCSNGMSYDYNIDKCIIDN